MVVRPPHELLLVSVEKTNVPPEKNTLGSINLKHTKSGTGEQFPLPLCRAADIELSLPKIRRQCELPRTSEVCPYIMKDLILRTSDVFVPRG